MKTIVMWMGMLLLLALPASAQVSVPNTFVTGTRILASEVNANFSALANDSLNRTGGTITGNITVNGGVTIDGVDIGTLSTVGTPTFSKLTLSSTAADALDVAGGINVGTGNVALITTSGKLAGFSSTYVNDRKFVDLYETVTTASISASAVTYDLSMGTHFQTTLNSNATVTISNAVATGTAHSFVITFTNDGTVRTITWPASVKWSAATAPTMTGTNGAKDVLTFTTYDGGTTWMGFVAGQDIR